MLKERADPDRSRDMKILLLTSELPPEVAGGIATYTATIAPALAARGHDVHVLSCASEHTFSDDYESGVWWHRRPLKFDATARRYPAYLQIGLRLASAVTAFWEARKLPVSFDVVEAPDWMAVSLLLSWTSRVPLVVSLHTPARTLCKYNFIPMDRDRRFADQLERIQTMRAKAIVSASQVMID